MSDKYYSIKPRDLKVGQIFKIQTESSSYDDYQLSEPIVNKGYMIEMQCTEIKTGMPKLVLYNTNFPREIYVEKLDSSWVAR